MDLIDRAKVERITFQEPSYSDPINVLTEVRDKVRALPTVDAIPVKWIEKYIDENPLYQADDFHWYIQDMIHDWMEKRKEE